MSSLQEEPAACALYRPGCAYDVTVDHRYRAPVLRNHGGGDFVAYERAASGDITIVVGDVSAKGSAGVRLAMLLTCAFRIAARQGSRPDVIADMLNVVMSGSDGHACGSDGFAAFFLASTNIARRELTYVSAGIEGAVAMRSDGEIDVLASGQLILGVKEQTRYITRTRRLLPGDAVLVCTDGVVEARSRAHHEVFLGLPGLVSMCRSARIPRGEPICETLLRRLDAFTGCRYDDDVTLVCFGVREE